MESLIEKMYKFLDVHYKVIVTNQWDKHKKLITFTENGKLVDSNYIYNEMIFKFNLNSITEHDDLLLLDIMIDWLNQVVGFETKYEDWI